MALIMSIVEVKEYQHQWELEQKKTDDLEVPKVEKRNREKTMEVIFLYLKLIKEMKIVPPAYVIRKHVRVVHILPGYDVHLNLDENMIARAPIGDVNSNLMQTQHCLGGVYVS